MTDVVKAGSADVEWLLRQDNHVGEAWVRGCVERGDYFVARRDGERAGFLRFSLFWGRIPYMEMIRVLPDYRRSGVGTALFHFWEGEMRRLGAPLLMTSSEADEPEPQAWHRRNGFAETGSIRLPGIQSAPEIFFVKQLT